ncbi:MAG TPA: LysM domain-containing protein [Thermoleophilia bacterium]|nr:LysM domain-containing protein [Thermoleophilia bacterium]
MSREASRGVARMTGERVSSALGGRGACRRPSSRAGRRELRRRRLAGLARLAFFLLLVFIAVWAGVRVAHAGGDAAIYQGERYVVGSGDTLWRIATRHYGDDVDPRRAVYDLREANGLEADAVLQPGDALVLPYGGE